MSSVISLLLAVAFQSDLGADSEAIPLASPWRAEAWAQGLDHRLLDALEQAVQNPVEVLIVFESAIPSVAAGKDRNEKARIVRAELIRQSGATRKAVVGWFEARGIDTESFWIADMSRVWADISLIERFIGDFRHEIDVGKIRVFRNEQAVLPDPATDAAARYLRAIPRFPGYLMEALGSGRPWHLDYLGAGDKPVTVSSGEGTLVGVIDSGVHWTHPAIRSRYHGVRLSAETPRHDLAWNDPVGGLNGERCETPCVSDGNGHGTGVTSIILGDSCVAQDGKSYRVGLSTEASWIACRAFLNGTGTLASLAACSQWMLERDPVPDVINLSGSFDPSPAADVVVRRLAIALEAAGVVLVASTGNPPNEAGSIVKLPAKLPTVVTTGGLAPGPDHAVLYASSGLGPTLEGLHKPDVVAPAWDVWAAAAVADRCSGISGTSGAAPLVTGVVLQLIEHCPRLRGRPDLVRRVLRFAVDPATPEPCRPLAGAPNEFGYGVPRVGCIVAAMADRRFDCRRSD